MWVFCFLEVQPFKEGKFCLVVSPPHTLEIFCQRFVRRWRNGFPFKDDIYHLIVTWDFVLQPSLLRVNCSFKCMKLSCTTSLGPAYMYYTKFLRTWWNLSRCLLFHISAYLMTTVVHSFHPNVHYLRQSGSKSLTLKTKNSHFGWMDGFMYYELMGYELKSLHQG